MFDYIIKRTYSLVVGVYNFVASFQIQIPFTYGWDQTRFKLFGIFPWIRKCKWVQSQTFSEKLVVEFHEIGLRAIQILRWHKLGVSQGAVWVGLVICSPPTFLFAITITANHKPFWSSFTFPCKRTVFPIFLSIIIILFLDK